MNWIFTSILVLGTATTVPVAFCQENKTDGRELLTRFKNHPPCVAVSSPCPLELETLPEALESRLAEAQKLFEAGNFAGSQAKLEAILVAQPESKIVLYDLALTHLKQGQRDEALVYQQRALRGVTHPYQRVVLDQLEREILYSTGRKDKTSLSLEEALPASNSPGKQPKDAGPGSSRNPVERADAEIQTVCSALKKQEHISESPSGVFDLAQCAEY